MKQKVEWYLAAEPSNLAEEPPSGRRNVEDNAAKPKPGWLLLCWFCPSTSTHAKVGRRPQLCHPDWSVA